MESGLAVGRVSGRYTVTIFESESTFLQPAARPAGQTVILQQGHLGKRMFYCNYIVAARLVLPC